MQVHQIELEMQNAELQEARDRMEALLEKYTDLYDFAPVGYFSLDEQGRILEVNLTGAALLGVERSRLINRRLPRFVAPTSRPIFLAFLEKVFAGPGKQVCEASLLNEDGTPFWANFQATSAVSLSGRAEMVPGGGLGHHRPQAGGGGATPHGGSGRHEPGVEAGNRPAAERWRKPSRKASNTHSQLLEQSRQMQEQLRHLSHQILQAQEEERKRISRELHDDIAQILTGINVHLATLKKEAAANTKGLKQKDRPHATAGGKVGGHRASVCPANCARRRWTTWG